MLFIYYILYSVCKIDRSTTTKTKCVMLCVWGREYKVNEPKFRKWIGESLVNLAGKKRDK